MPDGETELDFLKVIIGVFTESNFPRLNTRRTTDRIVNLLVKNSGGKSIQHPCVDKKKLPASF